MPFDHQGFYPQETALSPTDINTVVIRNYNSIILMKVTAFITEYITEIYVPQLKGGTLEGKVVVAKDSLFVLISGQA